MMKKVECMSELVGYFGEEEEAKDCANLYGIELIAFNFGVAVFTTEDNPEELIVNGKKNGWPPLSVNIKMTAF